MAGLHKKLDAWAEAGLITSPQAAAILAHEKDRKKNKFGMGLTGVAVFAILVGIVSLIAANWHDIPDMVKIGAHLVLNACVGGLALWAWKTGREWWREGATLGFFGLTLTLIALIGQVFQLGESLSGAVVVWMLCTLPFMALFSQGKMTAIPWTLAFLATITIVMSEYLPGLPEFWQGFFVIAVGTLLPLGLIGDGTLPLVQRFKPVYARVFIWTGMIMLAFNASAASIYWYNDRGIALLEMAENSGITYGEAYLFLAGIFIAAVAGIAAHAALFKYYRDQRDMQLLSLFMLGSTFMTALPVLIPAAESAAAAALTFIAYWAFIGWIAQMAGMYRLISLAIVLIAARIFAIYVEVFGDMLSTGFALITGGVVILVLIWAARRMNRYLTGRGAAHG